MRVKVAEAATLTRMPSHHHANHAHQENVACKPLRPQTSTHHQATHYHPLWMASSPRVLEVQVNIQVKGNLAA